MATAGQVSFRKDLEVADGAPGIGARAPLVGQAAALLPPSKTCSVPFYLGRVQGLGEGRRRRRGTGQGARVGAWRGDQGAHEGDAPYGQSGQMRKGGAWAGCRGYGLGGRARRGAGHGAGHGARCWGQGSNDQYIAHGYVRVGEVVVVDDSDGVGRSRQGDRGQRTRGPGDILTHGGQGRGGRA